MTIKNSRIKNIVGSVSFKLGDASITKLNTVTQDSPRIIANVMAGDSTWLPKFVGFVYGDIADPTGLTTDLNISWHDTISNISNMTDPTNIQIVPTAACRLHDDTSVIYTAHTAETSGVYVFKTSAPYANSLTTGHYMYHAILLAKPKSGYMPLARVSLANSANNYLAKPSGFEIALDWRISFV